MHQSPETPSEARAVLSSPRPPSPRTRRHGASQFCKSSPNSRRPRAMPGAPHENVTFGAQAARIRIKSGFVRVNVDSWQGLYAPGHSS